MGIDPGGIGKGLAADLVCADLLDDIVTVDNDEICAAVQDVYEDTRAIASWNPVSVVIDIQPSLQGLLGVTPGMA